MSKSALKGIVIGLAVAAAIVFAFGLTSAQPPWGYGYGPPGYYGRGPGWGYGPMMMGSYARFDPQAKKTVTGEVVRVERETPAPVVPWGGYYQLILKTEKEGELEVMLGPTFFIDRQKFELKADDPVEVEGFAVSYGQAPILFASKVKKGSAVLALRDEAGFPLWAGYLYR